MTRQYKIYENDSLVAFNKPAGVNFDWVLAEFPGLLSVHRLDKDTSGVIVFAKDDKTAEHMKLLFASREIQKTYLALVAGKVKNKKGLIDLPIGRSTKDFRKRVVFGKQGRERAAITEYELVKNLGDFSLLKVFPRTGRTHQIRTHLASLGYPIACDKLYGGKKFACPQGLTRQFLHAVSIEFTLPGEGTLRLEADLPQDLQSTLDMLS